MRIASPARAGRMLLNRYPTRSALVTIDVDGLCSGEIRRRHRIARKKIAAPSTTKAGMSVQ
jgi:hypothetical protein